MFIWSDAVEMAVNSRYIRDIEAKAEGPDKKTGKWYAVVYAHITDNWDDPGLEIWARGGFHDFVGASEAAIAEAKRITEKLNGENS